MENREQESYPRFPDGISRIRYPRENPGRFGTPGRRMKEVIVRSPELASLLEEHQEAIRESWVEQIRRIPESRYALRKQEEVRDWAVHALDALTECLGSGSTRPLGPYLEELVRVRRDLGFGIDEVVSALLLLRDTAFLILANRRSETARQTLETLAPLDILLRKVIARFSGEFADAMIRSVEEERQRTALMLGAAEAAGSSLDLGIVLERVAGGIASALGVPYCGILLTEGAGGSFRLRAKVGELPPGAVIREVLSKPLGLRESPLVAEAVRCKKPVCSRDLDLEYLLEGQSKSALGIDAACCIPVLFGDRVVAIALGVIEDSADALRADQMQLAGGLSNAVATAVENARLYEETARQLAESRSLQRVTAALLAKQSLDEVLEIVCREAERLSGADGSSVIMRNEKGEERVAFASGAARMWGSQVLAMLPLPNELAVPTELVLTGIRSETSVSPSSESPDSAIAFPLLVENASIGALVLLTRQERFADRDLQVIRAFADQGAIAIEHARLVEQHERIAVLEERQKLARELHDSATQSLYGVTMYAEAAARLLESDEHRKAAGYLRELRVTAIEALKEMRLLIHELRPPVLEEEGLVSALEGRLMAVERRAGMETSFSSGGIERLPEEIEAELYGFANEALNNILKHAKAARVSLELRRSGDGVILEIADDGVGFDLESGRRGGGLGLRGMEERAARLNSRLTIQTGPGEGTRLAIEMPLPPGN